MVEYKDRLAQAMKDAGVSVQKLADHLDITYQGVKKVLDGKSAALTAPNNAQAARLLGVSSDWLAIGDKSGHAVPADGAQPSSAPWPFPRISEKQVRALPEQDLHRIEGALALAIAQLKLKVAITNAGTPSILATIDEMNLLTETGDFARTPVPGEEKAR